MNIVHTNKQKWGKRNKYRKFYSFKMLEHQLASEHKFGQVDFRSHLPQWQVEILTKVTPWVWIWFACLTDVWNWD
jgi:hypothetical protein